MDADRSGTLLDHFDVLIIGSGAGARRSRTSSPAEGQKVLILEPA